MEAEALPVIDGLGLVRDDPPLLPAPAPAVSFSGRVGGLDVHVVCNGKTERGRTERERERYERERKRAVVK